MRRLLAAAVGAALVVVGMTAILQADDGLVRERTRVDGIPVSVLRPPGEGPFPGVVVAHGFSGSSRLMEGFGIALARDGWVAAMLDFPGHGANLDGITDADLPADVAAVSTWLAARADVSTAALLGHSMGADAVTQAAPELGPPATVALSLPSAEELDPAIPGLLLLVGSAEPARFVAAAEDAQDLGYPVRTVPVAEHVSILFRPPTLEQSVDWLDRAVGREASPVETDGRMPALAAVYVGSALLFWPLSGWVARGRGGWSPRRRPLLPLLVAMPTAGVVTGALLAVVPRLDELVPLYVGGYLAGFALVTGAVGWLLSRRVERPDASAALAGLVLGGYAAAALVVPAHLVWAEVSVAGPRAWAVAALAAAWIAFGWAELLLGWRRGTVGYGRVLLSRGLVAGVLLVLALLGLAPWFLLLLVPLLLVLLPWFGVYGVRVARLTGSPLAGALTQAPALALVVAGTTPVV